MKKKPMLEEKKQWHYVIELRNGRKFFADEVIGDHRVAGGSVDIVKTTREGRKLGVITVKNDDVVSFDENLV